MRFLVRELPYEKLLAAGRFEYRCEGVATGAVESWRYTAAVEGYRVWRMDLDARAAESGDSYLYHLVLNPAGRPERLLFRFFRPGMRIAGNVLFEGDGVTLSREVNGTRDEEELAVEVDTVFWFPAATALALLVGQLAGRETAAGLLLDREADFALRPVQVSAQAQEEAPLSVAGREITTRPVTIRWADQARTVWLDEHGAAVQVQRDDLLAVCTRYMRYGEQR